jgi:hypothetical protein
MSLRDEKSGKFIPQETKSIKEIAANIKNENDANKTQQQLLIAGNKINELKLKSEDLGTQKLDYTLQSIMDRLSNPKTTESGMKTALENLDNLVTQANELELTRASQAEVAAAGTAQSIVQLTDRIKSQNAILSDQLDMSALETQIKELSKGSNRLFVNSENQTRIQESFTEGQQMLTEAIQNGDNQAADIAMEHLKLVQDAAGSEEARRESAKAAADQSSKLGKMASGLEGLSGKFDGFADGIKSGGGFLAGLGALAMMIFSPETLAKFMTSAIASITDIINGIIKIFEGDISGGLKMLGDNALMVGIIIGGIVLQFGGAVIMKFAKLFKNVKAMMTAMKAFRLFMVTTAMPAIGAFFSGMISSITAALIPMAPIIGIGLLIAAAIGLFAFAMMKVRDALGFSSVFDVLFYGLAFVKDGIAHFANAFIRVAKKIGDLAGKLFEFLGIETPEFVTNMANMEEMDTNNAAKFKEEAQAKKLAKDAQIAEEEGLVAKEQSNVLTVATQESSDKMVKASAESADRLVAGIEARDEKQAGMFSGMFSRGKSKEQEAEAGSDGSLKSPTMESTGKTTDVESLSSENQAMREDLAMHHSGGTNNISAVRGGDTSNNTTVNHTSRRNRRGYGLNTASMA